MLRMVFDGNIEQIERIEPCLKSTASDTHAVIRDEINKVKKRFVFFFARQEYDAR